MRALAVLVCLLFSAQVLMAEGLKVGDPAPAFRAGALLINPHEEIRALEDCPGEVILIFEWQMRDPTRGQLDAIQRNWERHVGKGLHVFTIHRLNFEGAPEVRKMLREEGYTFPVAMGGYEDRGNNFEAYRNPGGGFRTTIVDMDGKVAFYGTTGWQPVLDREVARVTYPGLNRTTLAEPVERAARHLKERDFGRALTAAAELQRGDLSEEAQADLQLVMEHVNGIAERRNRQIDAWIEDRRYDLVLEALEVQRREFSRHEIGEAARTRAAELRRDREVRREVQSYEHLERLLQRMKGQDDQVFVNALKQFAEAQSEFRASGVARDIARNLEQVIAGR
jgi:hypothetical protein